MAKTNKPVTGGQATQAASKGAEAPAIPAKKDFLEMVKELKQSTVERVRNGDPEVVNSLENFHSKISSGTASISDAILFTSSMKRTSGGSSFKAYFRLETFSFFAGLVEKHKETLDLSKTFSMTAAEFVELIAGECTTSDSSAKRQKTLELIMLDAKQLTADDIDKLEKATSTNPTVQLKSGVTVQIVRGRWHKETYTNLRNFFIQFKGVGKFKSSGKSASSRLKTSIVPTIGSSDEVFK
jgi:hypothetical protein